MRFFQCVTRRRTDQHLLGAGGALNDFEKSSPARHPCYAKPHVRKAIESGQDLSMGRIAVESMQSCRLDQSQGMKWTTKLVFEAISGSLVGHKARMIGWAEA